MNEDRIFATTQYHAAKHFLATVLCSVSLLTLTAISLDRLLALLLGLRYRQVVTLKKACLTVIGFWILSIVGASTYFWNLHITRWYLHIALALCLVTTIFANTKIFFTLHHDQIRVQNHACCSRTTEASNSIEHRSIQKGSVQCTVGAGNIGCLLSAVWYNSSFTTSEREVFIHSPWFGIYGYFSVFELIIKPLFVLLEDQRSKASCKRNIKATSLSIELVFYAFRLLIRALIFCS